MESMTNMNERLRSAFNAMGFGIEGTRQVALIALPLVSTFSK
jgi:hypothetical protein